MKILRRTKGIDLKSKSSVLNYDAVQDGSTALSGLITIRYTKREEES